jgi:hypothetical protein
MSPGVRIKNSLFRLKYLTFLEDLKGPVSFIIYLVLLVVLDLVATYLHDRLPAVRDPGWSLEKWSILWNEKRQEDRSIWREAISLPLWPPLIPHVFTLDRTGSSLWDNFQDPLL